MTATHTYIFTLKCRTSKPEAGGVIVYAAAGGGAPFSPTRLTAEVVPAGTNPYSAMSTQQYTLSGNDGSTWAMMDGTNLVQSVTPGVNSTAVMGANVDLFTNSPGYNQETGRNWGRLRGGRLPIGGGAGEPGELPAPLRLRGGGPARRPPVHMG